MLGLGGEVKARIAPVLGMALVVVMVDPGSQAAAQLGDERAGGLVKRRTHAIGGESDVEDGHAPAQLARLGEVPRGRKHQLR